MNAGQIVDAYFESSLKVTPQELDYILEQLQLPENSSEYEEFIDGLSMEGMLLNAKKIPFSKIKKMVEIRDKYLKQYRQNEKNILNEAIEMCLIQYNPIIESYDDRLLPKKFFDKYDILFIPNKTYEDGGYYYDTGTIWKMNNLTPSLDNIYLNRWICYNNRDYWESELKGDMLTIIKKCSYNLPYDDFDVDFNESIEEINNANIEEVVLTFDPYTKETYKETGYLAKIFLYTEYFEDYRFYVKTKKEFLTVYDEIMTMIHNEDIITDNTITLLEKLSQKYPLDIDDKYLVKSMV
jgi:hypothetical protein